MAIWERSAIKQVCFRAVWRNKVTTWPNRRRTLKWRTAPKPGEGGQLPGRQSEPGDRTCGIQLRALIYPPHPDIYWSKISEQFGAILNANRQAWINVNSYHRPVNGCAAEGKSQSRCDLDFGGDGGTGTYSDKLDSSCRFTVGTVSRGSTSNAC